jgi:hypothetical protein
MPKPQDIYWVRYEPRRALTWVLRCSKDAELAHRRFADSVWAGDGWPSSDPRSAAHLARVSAKAWPALLAELLVLGWRQRRRNLYHPGVASVLAEARSTYDFLQQRAARAAAGRWAKDATPMLSPCLDHAKPMLSPCLDDAKPMLTPCTETVQKQNRTKTVKLTEHLMRSASVQKKAAPGEDHFMDDLGEVFRLFSPDTAEGEMENWGGWWRNRFRESPDKARRVLAEARSMVKEGTIRKTPGAAGADLWKRLP